MRDDLGGVVIGDEPAPDVNVVVPEGRPLDAVAAAVAANPLAARVLVDVLRLTERLPVAEGLLAESFAYSTLLAGPEHARWLAERGPRTPPPAGGEPGPLGGDGDEPVLLERDGDELVVTLHRPGRSNAVSAAVRDALVDALEVGLADPSLRVRLRGAGRSFSSGGDLDEFGTRPDVATAHVIRTTRSPGRMLHDLGDRLTVEVHGACVGAGTELAAFGARVVASGFTFFRLPELHMGLIPGAGGTVSVPRRIGRHRTAWLALTGARLDLDTAMAWGLVDERC